MSKAPIAGTFTKDIYLSMTTKSVFDGILSNQSKQSHNEIIRKRICRRINFECARTSIERGFQYKINQQKSRLNTFRDTRKKIEALFLPKMVHSITYSINMYIIASNLPALIQQRINQRNQESLMKLISAITRGGKHGKRQRIE